MVSNSFLGLHTYFMSTNNLYQNIYYTKIINGIRTVSCNLWIQYCVQQTCNLKDKHKNVNNIPYRDEGPTATQTGQVLFYNMQNIK